MLVVSPTGDIRWLDDAGSPPLYGDSDRDRPQAIGGARDGLPPRSVLGRPDRAARLAAQHGLERLGAAAAADSPPHRSSRFATSWSPRSESIRSRRRRRGPGRSRRPRRRDRLPPRVPRSPRGAARARTAMRAWLAERQIGDPMPSPLLAVGEACANAIEHAYLGSSPATSASRSRKTQNAHWWSWCETSATAPPTVGIHRQGSWHRDHEPAGRRIQPRLHPDRDRCAVPPSDVRSRNLRVNHS